MSDMTPITDMALPDEVWQAAHSARVLVLDKARHINYSEEVAAAETAAFRAALQAMVDCGMASISTHNAPGVPIFQLPIRLDADERKEQT